MSYDSLKQGAVPGVVQRYNPPAPIALWSKIWRHVFRDYLTGVKK